MVSLRRHFVPNPVSFTDTRSRTKCKPPLGIHTRYDAWNRLVEVSDGGVLIAKFRYDGEGRRILKMFDSQSPGDPDGLDTYEHLFLSGQQVIETREGTRAQPSDSPAQAETLQPKYQNIWSPRYIDSLILRDANTDTDGVCDDSRLYYLADANFNVTALVDTSGDVVERYLYSPYGEVTILDPDFTPDADGASDYANTTLYTGRTLDAATGLMYYRARYYHPELGRFVGRDPIGYRDGTNCYGYVGSQPLIRLDPTGTRKVATPEYGIDDCTIYVLIGHTTWTRPVVNKLEREIKSARRKGDDLKCVRLGTIACISRYNQHQIPNDLEVSGWPWTTFPLWKSESMNLAANGIRAAIEEADYMNWCDDCICGCSEISLKIICQPDAAEYFQTNGENTSIPYLDISANRICGETTVDTNTERIRPGWYPALPWYVGEFEIACDDLPRLSSAKYWENRENY